MVGDLILVVEVRTEVVEAAEVEEVEAETGIIQIPVDVVITHLAAVSTNTIPIRTMIPAINTILVDLNAIQIEVEEVNTRMLTSDHVIRIRDEMIIDHQATQVAKE